MEKINIERFIPVNLIISKYHKQLRKKCNNKIPDCTELCITIKAIQNEKLELSIPGMQSAHCQETVNNAIKTINGIEVQHMEAGKLSVSIDSAEIKELVNAIEKQAIR